MNNTGRCSRACELQAAQKASVVADNLGTVTGDLLRLQPGAVTVTPASVSDRHSAADSTLSECFHIIFQTKN